MIICSYNELNELQKVRDMLRRQMLYPTELQAHKGLTSIKKTSSTVFSTTFKLQYH